MDLLNKIWDFLVDSNRHFSAKASIFGLTLLTIFLLNDVTGFTYYYNTKNKIEQVKALADITRDTLLSATVRIEALALQQQVLTRQTIPEQTTIRAKQLYADFQGFLDNRQQSSTKVVTHSSSGIPVESVMITTNGRNNFIFLMTTSGIALLVIVIMIPIGIVLIYQQGWGSATLGAVAVEIVFLLIAWFSYITLNLIPMLGSTWTWNYVLNSCIQVGSVGAVSFFLYKLGSKS
jgi:hypothetical protein